MRETINAHKLFDEKPQGKRPIRRPRRGSEDVIKVDLREICVSVKWIESAQDTPCEHGNDGDLPPWRGD
jgi:hypothetical protein